MRDAATHLAGILFPGLGHLLRGERRAGLLFALPALLSIAAIAAWYLADGGIGLLAFAVGPGALALIGTLNLFVAGWTLALARERSGNLALPIGIHAGWVLTSKGQSAFVAFAAASSPTLWGSHKVFDGYAASLALAIQLLVVHRLARRPPMAAAT